MERLCPTSRLPACKCIPPPKSLAVHPLTLTLSSSTSELAAYTPPPPPVANSRMPDHARQRLIDVLDARSKLPAVRWTAPPELNASHCAICTPDSFTWLKPVAYTPPPPLVPLLSVIATSEASSLLRFWRKIPPPLCAEHRASCERDRSTQLDARAWMPPPL
eukprot:2276645-Rhodomonas_salina.1